MTAIFTTPDDEICERYAMRDSAEYMTIGEVAELAGLQTSTLRYYESIGLLPPPRRVSGQRRYNAEVLSLLAVIQLAKDAHFTLPEIRILLYGPSDYDTPSERWRDLARQKLREIDAIIARAQEIRQLLEEGLDCDSLQVELDDCAPLLRPAESEG